MVTASFLHRTLHVALHAPECGLPLSICLVPFMRWYASRPALVSWIRAAPALSVIRAGLVQLPGIRAAPSLVGKRAGPMRVPCGAPFVDTRAPRLSTPPQQAAL